MVRFERQLSCKSIIIVESVGLSQLGIKMKVYLFDVNQASFRKPGRIPLEIVKDQKGFTWRRGLMIYMTEWEYKENASKVIRRVFFIY